MIKSTHSKNRLGQTFDCMLWNIPRQKNTTNYSIHSWARNISTIQCENMNHYKDDGSVPERSNYFDANIFRWHRELATVRRNCDRKLRAKYNTITMFGGFNLPFTANFNIGRSLGKSPEVRGAGKVRLNRLPLSTIRESVEMVRKTTPSHGRFADKHVRFV